MTKQQIQPEGSARKSKPVYSIPERNYSPSAFGGIGDGSEELDFSLVNEAPQPSSEKSDGLFSRARSWFKDKLIGAADIASDVVIPIQEGLVEAGDVVNERVVDPVQDVISDRLVDPAKSVLRERVIQPLSEGLEAVTKTATDVVDIADDIATPTQKGLTEAGDNFNERIVDPVKNTLSDDIFDPAKSLLRDQIIEPIVEGGEATARTALDIADIVNDVVTPIQEGLVEAGDIANERIFDALKEEITERMVESLTKIIDGGDALASDQLQEVLEVPEITPDTALETAEALTKQDIPRSVRPVESGNTLWQIAQEELGDGNRWVELQKADGTTFTIEESRRLQIGSEVYIPGTQEAATNINIATNDVTVESPNLESEGVEEATTLEEPPLIEQPELPAIKADSDFYRSTGTNPFAARYQGQCTWFSYGRMLETGLMPDNVQTSGAFLGNAGTWEGDARRLGLSIVDKPEDGKSYLMVFPPKVRGAGGVGHVAFFENILPNGDIRISESNWSGKGIAERDIPSSKISGIKFVELSRK